MPQITALEKQRKNSARINVYLDNRFAFGLTQDLVNQFGLAIGLELSEKRIADLKEKAKLETFLTKVYHYLSYRPRSEREVDNYLDQKGVKEPMRVKIVDYLKERNFLNDEEFAKWWLEQRNRFRPRSRFALKIELVQKGISEEIISRVLSGIDEQRLVKELIARKQFGMEGSDLGKSREKLIGYLKRRGFSWQVIKAGLEEFDF
ncbi:MAG: RecX family transcriptional regulator [Candidatus Shapirobacteria bacterium]|nr:RecX family transcriptional regulator [Candidatus Shapirobacteria bacterium]